MKKGIVIALMCACSPDGRPIRDSAVAPDSHVDIQHVDISHDSNAYTCAPEPGCGRTPDFIWDPQACADLEVVHMWAHDWMCLGSDFVPPAQPSADNIGVCIFHEDGRVTCPYIASSGERCTFTFCMPMWRFDDMRKKTP